MMNRTANEKIDTFHVSAVSGNGTYCFIVYAIHGGHSYVSSIEADNQEQLERNIRSMFTTIRHERDLGKFPDAVVTATSRIILKEHSNA